MPRRWHGEPGEPGRGLVIGKEEPPSGWPALVHRLRDAARGGGWMVSGAGVQAAVAFGANLVLVRLLSPRQFGHYAAINATIGLVGAFTNLKLQDLILREPEEALDQERLSLFTGALAVRTLVVGVGAAVVLSLFGLFDLYAVLLLVSVLASAWVHALVTLYEREFEYTKISIIETGAHAGGHLFTVLGALAGLGALVLYLRLAVKSVGKAVGLWAVDGVRPLPVRWPGRSEWQKIFEKIRDFWLDGVLAQAFERVVVLLVSILVGERGTGFFYQARRLAIVPHQLLAPLTDRVLYNFFSHRTHGEERRRILRRGLVGETVVLGAAALLALFFADPIVPLIFGQDWQPVVPLLRTMGGMIIAMTMLNTLNAYYMSMARLRPFIMLGRGGQYFGLFGTVAVMVLLTDLDGAVAVSVGLSIAYVLGTAASWGYAEIDQGTVKAARDQP